MWHNVWAVIRREYLQRVRSKWFIAATIGGPVIMAGLLVVPAWQSVTPEPWAMVMAEPPLLMMVMVVPSGKPTVPLGGTVMVCAAEFSE